MPTHRTSPRGQINPNRSDSAVGARAPRSAAASFVAAALLALVGAGGAAASPYQDEESEGPNTNHSSREHARSPRHERPINVTVFSPGPGDLSGAAGVGFIVDVALDANKPRYNSLLSAAAGYIPFFNDPMAPTFHPGPDPGAPGLVVLLSTTPNKPGTPLQGPNTNLAGLFQINGVATVHGKAETWNTWQPGKPIFGTGASVLTVYAVSGVAPTLVPSPAPTPISNVVRVPFRIAG